MIALLRLENLVMRMSKLQIKPPMINGVSASQVYLPKSDCYTTYYHFFCENFEHISKQEWQQRFQDQLVLNEQLQPVMLDTPYCGDQHFFYYRFLANEISVPFEHTILFENDALLVVDKPHFLTISPTGQYLQETLLVRLKHQTQNPDLTPIHRLDRETAGVVLFCKDPKYRAIYQALFSERQVKKTYHAIAPYNPNIQFPLVCQHHMQKGDPFYTMQIVNGLPPNSETKIDLIEHNERFAKYVLYPHTGKQHQLRVHLSALGLPILNDSFYPTVVHKAPNDFDAPLQLLAKAIEFTDPLTHQQMYFESNYCLVNAT